MEKKEDVKVEVKEQDPAKHISEMSGSDLNAKSTIGKLAAFLSDKFLKPSIITVFVTALLGPVAVGWINDSIENKKLQEKVIQTVLNYTNEADFSRPESIEKIGIIAQMVNENKELFSLSFEETNKAIDHLNEASNDVGIKNLTNKLKEAKGNIKDLKSKLAADSIVLAKYELENSKLLEKKEKYDRTGSLTKALDVQNQLSKIELDIKELTNSRSFYREQIRYWTEQKILLEKDIADASNNLSEVLKRNRSNEDLLKQEKEQLKEELAKTLSGMNLLEAKVAELEKQNQELTDSINTLKIVKKK